MCRMEKVVDVSCILMSLLGYSISRHLIKAWLARAVLLTIPPLNVETLLVEEKTGSRRCAQAWMEAGGENRNLEAPTSWPGEIVCRAWTSFIPREAGGKWPPGVPHLNQTLKQPPGVADHLGELLAGAAVAPLEWDLEEQALQTTL